MKKPHHNVLFSLNSVIARIFCCFCDGLELHEIAWNCIEIMKGKMLHTLYIYIYYVLMLIMLLFHPQDILLPKSNSVFVIERKATYFRVWIMKFKL